jgi:CHAT domain-containing protein
VLAPELSDLPIAALPAAASSDRRGGSHLIDHVSIESIWAPHFLSSASARKSENTRSYLGIGNPRIKPDRHVGAARLPSLPDAEEEVRSVAAYYGAYGSVIVGSDATKAKLRALQLSRFSVLHFATHGLLPGDVQGLDDAALLLSSPEGQTTTPELDEYLTASEILQLDIAADVVVLSACNSAGAGNERGIALSGLARSFIFAGAKAVVVSHWPVRSKFAAEFGKELGAVMGAEVDMGMPQVVAEVTRRLKRRGFADPGDWAAFFVVGAGGRR